MVDVALGFFVPGLNVVLRKTGELEFLVANICTGRV
jgi:hypothetical protein